MSLEDTVKFDSAHIASPDRVYFDLHKALVGPGMANKTIDVKNGLLKSVRVGQNREGVVRLVLDVDGARDWSAYLVSNPYRLVIEVRNNVTVTTAKNGTGAPAQPASATLAATPTKDDAEKADTNASERTNETVSASGEKQPATAKLAAKLAATPAANSTPSKSKSSSANSAALQPPTEPKPTRDGQHSLTRALGLKIGRIVIDAGHGGHDTGTIGPHGLMEKDLCLDVALRLGHLIEQKLPGAEVVYTRKDDTFIPLEERTAIANEAKADLFISIHANSSHDHEARGIETYYLNFATSEESLEVATRENSLSQEGLHDLQDIVKKIARNEKIEESKEFANDVQDSLSHRMQLVSQNERNRGVKKAPFVVLIGANMPSILSEISFISNPSDEKLLRKGDQRQRVADGLYRGIAAYLDNLNSLSYGKTKLVSDNRSASVPGQGDQANRRAIRRSIPKFRRIHSYGGVQREPKVEFRHLIRMLTRHYISLSLVTMLLSFAAISTPAQAVIPDSFAGWSCNGRSAFNPAQPSEIASQTASSVGNNVLAEYGFVAGEQCEYTRASEKLGVQVYRMKDPSGAYGLYSYMRTADLPHGSSDRAFGAWSLTSAWRSMAICCWIFAGPSFRRRKKI